MANRAYLLCVDDPSTTWSQDPEIEIIAEGIGAIPVFWASLFVPGDRQVDTYEGDTEPLEIANWCTKLVKAKRRLAEHRKSIMALLDDRAAECWSQWCDHIATERGKFIKTNAAEVWMLDPTGYDAYCQTLLRLFQQPTADYLEAALAANDLSFADGSIIWHYEEATICKLAGAPHIRDVPWLNPEILATSQVEVIASVAESNRREEKKRAAQFKMDRINAEKSTKSVDELTPEECRMVELERKFWLGDLDTYREYLAENAFVVYPRPLGILGRQQLIGAAEVMQLMDAPMWTDVFMTDFRIIYPSSNFALLIYHADARRNETDPPYRAIASSVYVGLDGNWKLAFHQQSPDVERPESNS